MPAPLPTHLKTIGLLLLAAQASPVLAQTADLARAVELRTPIRTGSELATTARRPVQGGPTAQPRPHPLAHSQVLTLQPAETLFESTSSPHEGVSTVWRLSGGLFLDPGRIVVGDSRAAQLFIVNIESDQVQPVGRRGEGPGEFQRIRGPRRAAEGGFFVDDFMMARVTRFAADGSLLNTIAYNPTSFRSGPFVLRAIGLHSDGTIIFRDGEPLFSERPDGPYREKIGYVARMADGASATIAEADGLEMERRNLGGGFSTFEKPFSYSVVEAVAGDLVLLADTESGILSAYDRGGEVAMTFDFGPGDQVTREADRLWREAKVEGTNERDRTLAQSRPDAPPEAAALMAGLRGLGSDEEREYYRSAEGNARAPALSRLLVDGDGRVWAERFALPGAETVVWQRWNPGTGRIDATLELPRDHHLLDALGDRVLLRTTDELGVQRAVVMTLRVAG